MDRTLVFGLEAGFDGRGDGWNLSTEDYGDRIRHDVVK
jgi:hypothetical protein